MVGWANAARPVRTVSDFTTVNNNVIGFHRGDRAWIGINDSGTATTATFTTGLADGGYCDVIAGSATAAGCTGGTVTVSGGRATVTVPANGAVALHVGARPGTSPSPTASPTASPTTSPTDRVATTFTVNATPTAGQDVYVVGSVPELGAWTPANGVRLTAQGGGVYRATVDLPRSTSVEYKFVKVTTAGAATWESGANRTLTTPATGTYAVTETFRGDTVSTAVATSFAVTATTVYGQNVFVVGNVAALGGWNPAGAVALSPATYPVWRATVDLPPNTAVEYKYVKKNPDGSVTWESGANRSFTTPAGGTRTATDTWR
ncbi:carbohydrate-binding module family 20 domain-containing protein [Micromonospora schwarzwaldensis]